MVEVLFTLPASQDILTQPSLSLALTKSMLLIKEILVEPHLSWRLCEEVIQVL